MTFLKFGVPETIRTSDPFLRREVLYPAELRGQVGKRAMYTRVARCFQLYFAVDGEALLVSCGCPSIRS